MDKKLLIVGGIGAVVLFIVIAVSIYYFYKRSKTPKAAFGTMNKSTMGTSGMGMGTQPAAMGMGMGMGKVGMGMGMGMGMGGMGTGGMGMGTGGMGTGGMGTGGMGTGGMGTGGMGMSRSTFGNKCPVGQHFMNGKCMDDNAHKKRY